MERNLFLLLLLWGVSVLSAKEPCATNQFTASGECCKVCYPGEGVVQPCGVNQTVCESCLDSVTYSDTLSHVEPCKPCTECLGRTRMIAPCVETDDAICACSYGYFLSKETGQCEKCQSCPLGHGMEYPCSTSHDTTCEVCPEETFSDEDNNMDPCLPCTLCESDEIMVEDCTRVSDRICKSTATINPRFTPRTPTLPSIDSDSSDVPEGPDSTDDEIMDPDEPIMTLKPYDPDRHSSTTGGMTTPAMGSSEPVPTRSMAHNLIPVYCSILAAVVVGLVAFIVFKRWSSCKQNKQAANNRPVNQTPSPEGEKLHSDSGISVDSQSLHDQQSQTQLQVQALKSILSSNKQEELEKLLSVSADDTWRNLAKELGYKDELIDSFSQDEVPVHAFISHLFSTDAATRDAFYSALRKIEREDIVESLYSESTATSPV